METLYNEESMTRSIEDIHKTTLKRYAARWKTIISVTTCLSCIARTPEYKHRCGHYICGLCVQRLGQRSDKRRYAFVLKVCILCQEKSNLEVRIPPPTTGVGVLSIDGGGIRGVVPTTILELLQEAIGPEIPIQELFQLVIGTSSGKHGPLVLDRHTNTTKVHSVQHVYFCKVGVLKNVQRLSRPWRIGRFQRYLKAKC